jgi:hypothetical protein
MHVKFRRKTMNVNWYSSNNVFASGVALEIDHNEVLLLIDAVTQGENALANLIDNLLSNFEDKQSVEPGAVRTLIVAAIRGIFTTQTQRIRDADQAGQSNGVFIVMPWQWISLGFFWFFEINPRSISIQVGWRWCHKCQGLYFGEDRPLGGSCPAGGQHERGVSGNYTLGHNQPNSPGQPDWRWCHKCDGLFFSGGQELVGTCPSGGQHEKGVSGNYTLAHNQPYAPGQPDWRWCHKCHGLFFSGEQELVGTCPAGGQHEKGASGIYTLGHTPA